LPPPKITACTLRRTNESLHEDAATWTETVSSAERVRVIACISLAKGDVKQKTVQKEQTLLCRLTLWHTG
jgi:hypothetical protein